MKISKVTIGKFIGATIVLYGFLITNVFHVGDIIVPSPKDYLNQPEASSITTSGQIQTDINEALQEDIPVQTHGSAGNSAQEKFNEICQSNTSLCNKMQFIGNFTDTEKYTDIASLFKIGGFIDNTIVTKQKIENALQQIKVNRDEGKRGYADHNTIVLNIGNVLSKNEFLELLSHEMGHVVDLGVLEGSNNIFDQKFTEFGAKVFRTDDVSLIFYALSRESEHIRKALSTKKDFCSGYGMTDPFEDFAECFNLYLNHNQLFRLMARSDATMGKKYNTIAAIFDGIYINQRKSDTVLVQKDTSRRPRDTTRIVSST